MGAGQVKLVVLATAGVLLAGITGVIAYEQWSGPGLKPRQVRVAVDPSAGATPSGVPLPDLNDPKWQPAFHARYDLQPGELVKRVAPPFIPARQNFYLKIFGPSQYNAIPRGPDMIVMNWTDANQLPQMRGASFGGGSVQYILESILGIQPWDFQPGAEKLMSERITGDWVIRGGTQGDALRTALLTELSNATHATLTMEQSPIAREAIIVRGTLKVHPMTTQPMRGRPPTVLLYYGTPGKPNQWYYVGRTLMDAIATTCDRPVVVEGDLGHANIEMRADRGVFMNRPRRGSPEEAKRIDELLANLAKQTSLQFTRETRTLPAWKLTKGTALQAGHG